MPSWTQTEILQPDGLKTGVHDIGHRQIKRTRIPNATLPVLPQPSTEEREIRLTMREYGPRVILGVVIGLVIGILYGWVIRPVEYVNTTPDSLREDYRTDYVLMVAEIFTSEQDLERAIIRLAALGPDDPQEMVTQATEYAIESGFSRQDINRLNALSIGLKSLPQPAEIDMP
jgi:hypothetical protein